MSRKMRHSGAFTLVEMLVVIGIIILIASISLPTIINIFRSGADSQAYNVVTAQLAAARSLAIVSSSYAMVHFQPADNTTDSNIKDTTDWCAVMIYKNIGSAQNPNCKFVLADGYTPRRMPGSMGFGEISNSFVSVNAYQDAVTNNSGKDFMTFNVIFSPRGQVTKTVGGAAVSFDSNDPIFSGGGSIWNSGTANNGRQGASAMTMFDFGMFYQFAAGGKTTEAKNLLNQNGQFLPVNIYTGQLFPRQ